MSKFERIKLFYERFKRYGKTKWFYYKALSYFISKFYGLHSEKIGVDIMEEDWDYLIILDACRWDTFCEVFGEKVNYRYSKGSNTYEFAEKNFGKRKFLDTIYVTANPVISILCENNFYKMFHLWKIYWNENIGTVLPKYVYRASLRIANKYPDKRLIIHFLQPHYPYVSYYKEDKNSCPWDKLKKGLMSSDKLYYYYKQDLKLVLFYALKLAEKLKGKIVITSDHGECFGERVFPWPIRFYGHKGYLHIEPLIKVPWLEINKRISKKCYS